MNTQLSMPKVLQMPLITEKSGALHSGEGLPQHKDSTQSVRGELCPYTTAHICLSAVLACEGNMATHDRLFSELVLIH